MKPVIFWGGLDDTLSLPANQDDYQWNKEPDGTNTTHVGTKFLGDPVAASVGLDLGAMTNLQEGDEFPIFVSHSAIEPVTNCQFYFTVSGNVRGAAVGFANEDDPTYPTSGQSGAEKDFDELRAWGDGLILPSDPSGVDNTLYKYGMRLRYQHDTDPTPMSTGVLDELANSKMLDNNGKLGGGLGSVGSSPVGEEDWIEPWVDFVSNDCAAINLSLSIPDVEAAGVRQCALVLRLTYTF
jgi:hypothetical protein